MQKQGVRSLPVSSQALAGRSGVTERSRGFTFDRPQVLPTPLEVALGQTGTLSSVISLCGWKGIPTACATVKYAGRCNGSGSPVRRDRCLVSVPPLHSLIEAHRHTTQLEVCICTQFVRISSKQLRPLTAGFMQILRTLLVNRLQANMCGLHSGTQYALQKTCTQTGQTL